MGVPQAAGTRNAALQLNKEMCEARIGPENSRQQVAAGFPNRDR
jgi:hypothetical protein